jgi:2-polyprenyl-3-methyl-5-hydroxy-6-metoxy-1,4-benzoquinol methylase
MLGNAMGREAKAAVYDIMHEKESSPDEPVTRSCYYPMWQRIVDLVQSKGPTSILEVGCGGGRLAEMLITGTNAGYCGFDFSPVAVRQATARTCRPEMFSVGNALDHRSYDRPYDLIVSTEVLEHIEGDLSAIRLWKPGTYCVCSVPNFDDATHVRHFRHEVEVLERYDGLIAIDTIQRIAKPILRGTTLTEYLRRLRWSRDRPKKMFGLLGVNRFDWNAGWFLFAGTRRN